MTTSDSPGTPSDSGGPETPPAIDERLRHLSEHFVLPGRCESGHVFGDGHIHDTFLTEFRDGDTLHRFVHQRINHHVFPDPPAVMDNISRVTEHLRKWLHSAEVPDAGRRALRLVPTRDESSYYRDPSGAYWRTYDYVEDTVTWNSVQSREQAYHAAHAFAHFLGQLSDLGPPRLQVTIPGFHDTPRRLEQYETALHEDPEHRADECASEIEFVAARRSLAHILIEPQRRGELPERIVHNDTKLNNVLMDTKTGEGICVVDLDTVMPGLVHYDFGDLVRTAACTTAEDSLDLDAVELDMETFAALADGFLDGSRAFLTPVERESLVDAGPLITFETGLRFLTDFLLGDKYFKTTRRTHNLDRARVQFGLLASMERQRARVVELLRRPSVPGAAPR